MTKKEKLIEWITKQFKIVPHGYSVYIQIDYIVLCCEDGEEVTLNSYGETTDFCCTLHDTLKFLNKYNDNLELIVSEHDKSKYPINVAWEKLRIISISAGCPLNLIEK